MSNAPAEIWIFIVLVEEQVVAIVIEETLVTVHAGAVNAEYRLGHERGGQSVLRGDRFHGVLQGQHIIRRLDRIRKTEIDLVLAQCHFVMSNFHLESHRAQCIHQLGADACCLVERGEVEVSAHIMRHRMNSMTISAALEQEELRFRSDVIGPAAFSDLCQSIASTHHAGRLRRACHPA